MSNPVTTRYTQSEWIAEGRRRFGDDQMQWRFVCPICKHVACVQDWKDASASEGEVAFSCVGRHIEGAREAFGNGRRTDGPCNYAGGGLFRMNPVEVLRDDGKSSFMFAFAEAP